MLKIVRGTYLNVNKDITGMNILITGAKGFVGRNLAENLKTIRDGKNRTRPLTIGEIYEYDIDTDPALLKEYCQKANFVFN